VDIWIELDIPITNTSEQLLIRNGDGELKKPIFVEGKFNVKIAKRD
jgi:hypothetical protein